MLLQEAEQSIVDRIATAPERPEILRVVAWPDSPLEYGRAQMQTGIYVRFAGFRFPPVEGQRQPYVQRGTANFEIRLLLKDLRSHAGAYEWIEAVHRRLTGFRPPGNDAYSFGLPGLWLSEVSLVDRYKESNQWDWGAIFSTNVIYEGHYGDRNWIG
jgi:hypothetical protein